ncbi:MAG: hypothetical protein Q9M18_01965 [Mariprofundaceae bacterium]|nr:hypothetical protein [Mariprofundaceae bacterium]
MSNDPLDDDTSKTDAEHWNQRNYKKPIKWYILLMIVCGGIAWILSNMGSG